MRAFIAIDIPSALEQHLAELQEHLKDFGTMTFPKRFHITLQFLGEVPAQQIEQLKTTLCTIAFSPFHAQLSSIGIFPSNTRMRVIWVGVKPVSVFETLQRTIGQEMTSIGFVPEKRFHPHITLARVKYLKDTAGLNAVIEKRRPKTEAFLVDHVTLYESTLTKQGSIYHALAVFPGKP